MLKRFCERFRSHLRSKTRILRGEKPHEVELWTGIRNEIPLCCIIFYHSVWLPTIRNEIVDYGKSMTKLTENQGIILCPDCITKKFLKN